jgi:hypothetical protein
VEKKVYADIWGDTVDLRHLAAAMVIGIVIALGCYVLGLNVIQSGYPKLAKNLVQGYALLVGIVGSLIAAVVSAKLFAPKRVLKEDEFSLEDRALVIRELQIDLEREGEDLKQVPEEIIREMKELQIYDLFAPGNGDRKGGN